MPAWWWLMSFWLSGWVVGVGVGILISPAVRRRFNRPRDSDA